jgi:hypothetical protein
MANELFRWACGEIEKNEKLLEHKLSWRFLTTPQNTLLPKSQIAFIALNPGGNFIPQEHGKESSEIGSAYIYENWKSTALQNQVQCLFQEIGRRIKEPDYKSLMNNSLMAYYIPFRSPNIKKLINPKESKKFSYRLWSHILQNISLQLIITIDRNTFEDINKILIEEVGFNQMSSMTLPTGWGDYTADVCSYNKSKAKIVLARLPHLSRFKIFARSDSELQVRKIVTEMTNHME